MPFYPCRAGGGINKFDLRDISSIVTLDSASRSSWSILKAQDIWIGNTYIVFVKVHKNVTNGINLIFYLNGAQGNVSMQYIGEQSHVVFADNSYVNIDVAHGSGSIPSGLEICIPLIFIKS